MLPAEPYRDRTAAGRQLAQKLQHYRGRNDVVVLALPRGGVPVAAEVARELGAPLDVFVVRKLGVPGHEELAMGAIASGGVRVLNDDVLQALPNSELLVDVVTEIEREELVRREQAYRGHRPAPELANRIVILIDDGLATGASMRAAVAALRQRDVAKIVVAVPVGAINTCRELEREVDEIICGAMPENFIGVGQYYEDFSQTSDDEVRQLLSVTAIRNDQKGNAAV